MLRFSGCLGIKQECACFNCIYHYIKATVCILQHSVDVYSLVHYMAYSGAWEVMEQVKENVKQNGKSCRLSEMKHTMFVFLVAVV